MRLMGNTSELNPFPCNELRTLSYDALTMACCPLATAAVLDIAMSIDFFCEFCDCEATGYDDACLFARRTRVGRSLAPVLGLSWWQLKLASSCLVGLLVGTCLLHQSAGCSSWDPAPYWA